MTERRDYFHCSSCFTHQPLSAYAGKRNGRRICTNCATRLERAGHKLDKEATWVEGS